MDKISINLNLDELSLICSAVFRTLETLNEDTIKIFWPQCQYSLVECPIKSRY